MTASIIVAKIMAVTYLCLSAGLIFNKSYYKKELLKLLDDSGLVFVGSFIAIVCGMLVLYFQNTWENNWTVLVTIIGWLTLFKGMLYMAFPKSLKFFKPLYTAKNFNLLLVICLILGLVFGYYGFLV